LDWDDINTHGSTQNENTTQLGRIGTLTQATTQLETQLCLVGLGHRHKPQIPPGHTKQQSEQTTSVLDPLLFFFSFFFYFFKKNEKKKEKWGHSHRNNQSQAP
jgi:hypothetical protein